MKAYDVWGSQYTYPHMSVGWTWAFGTPFKWTKQVASHFGGTRQGMCIAWPKRIKDAGGIRTQFHHMIDIVPTILEVAGIPAPQTVDGIAQKPIEGVSMAYTFDKQSLPIFELYDWQATPLETLPSASKRSRARKDRGIIESADRHLYIEKAT